MSEGAGTAVDEDIQVEVLGSVLASLMERNLQLQSDREGLLFGTSAREDFRINSDSQSNVSGVRRRIVVSDYQPFSRMGELYDGAGRLKAASVLALEEEEGRASLVGWYRCRWSSACRPTLRETSVQRALVARREAAGGHRSELTLLLLTGDRRDALVRLHQAAFVLDAQHSLQLVPLHVQNVGGHGTPRYRTTPFSCLGSLLPPATPSSPSPRKGEMSSSGVPLLDQCMEVERNAATALTVLAGRLVNSNCDLRQAYEQVEALRKQKMERETEKKQTDEKRAQFKTGDGQSKEQELGETETMQDES